MAFRCAAALCCLVMAGCAAQWTEPTADAPAAVVTQPSIEVPAPPVPTPGETVAEVPDASYDTSPSPPVSAVESAEAAAPSAESVAEPPEPVDRPAAAATPTPAGRVAAPLPADTLDFSSLSARLRTTKAMGVLAKLSVKNQADDLLAQFREYHTQQGTATLPDLRRSFDSLVLDLLSLVGEGDPPLAVDIARSRTAIWNILCDPSRFIDGNLMAGAAR